MQCFFHSPDYRRSISSYSIILTFFSITSLHLRLYKEHIYPLIYFNRKIYAPLGFTSSIIGFLPLVVVVPSPVSIIMSLLISSSASDKTVVGLKPVIWASSAREPDHTCLSG